MNQFFGKTTWRVFAGLALATLLGAALLRIPEAHVVALVFLILAGAWSYWKKPEFALTLVFAELFAFSHGKLFETEVGGFIFTSRMALFVGIMLAWGWKWIVGKARPMASPVFWTPWLFLAGALLIGLLTGLARNETKAVLDDFNGYVYALYLLPLLSTRWTREARLELLQTLVGAALWISALSLGLLYVFTHLPNEALEATYKFIRDARIGEITLMEGGYWRVFIQSQIVLIPTLLLLLAFDTEMSMRNHSLTSKDCLRSGTNFESPRPARPKLWSEGGFKISSPIAHHTRCCYMFWLLAFAVSGLVISLSRSFWIGLIVAVPLLFALLVRSGLRRELFSRLPCWLFSGVIAFALLATAALTVFPVPSRVVDLRETFSSRTTETGDLAVSSRWNLLPVMLDAMREAPVIGSGFGRELAFVSDDPRVREIYPDGKWRTYKFEWGWLDLWVKTGALGFLAFILLFLTYDRLLRESLSQPMWLRAGLRASLVALAAIHIFSPYLNHPLGLGIFLFITAFLDFEERPARSLVTIVEDRLNVPNLASPVPTIQSQTDLGTIVITPLNQKV